MVARPATKTGRHAEQTWLSAELPVEHRPRQTTRARGEVRGRESTGGQSVGRQGAASVEAEPADPQHRRRRGPCRSCCAAASAHRHGPGVCRGTRRKSSAETPELMWTTVPPAKSKRRRRSSRHAACHRPGSLRPRSNGPAGSR